MCGLKKIDGYVFCLGVDLLNDSYRAHQDLQGLIRSVTYLIRGAIFRAEYSTGSSGRSSLDICPLGELIDMYHAHEATKRHDKVYALLGMSSDNLSKADLSPDYKVTWEKLLQRLVKYLISEEISVETLGNQETAVIKSKGCVLGKVTSVESDPVRNDQQRVGVALRDIPEHLEGMKEWKSPWILQVSAKPVQIGDFICLLQGASNPLIVRLREDYFVIVMIAVTLPKRIREGKGPNRWPTSSLPEAFFSRKFLLVWDWEIASENLQDLEDYGAWMRMNYWGSEHSRLELGGYLAKGTRVWNIALILEDLNEYEKAEGRYQDAVKYCEMAIEGELSNTLGDQYDPTLRLWTAENDYNAVVDLLLTDGGIDPDSNNRQSKLAPLLWAALGGHKAVVKLLLETGKVNVELEDRRFQRTSLSLAAERGHEAVVRLLLKSNANVDILEKTGDTPLRWAVKGGHKVVVQLLLDTCKVDIDSKDQYGRTLLGWAAAEGHETAVRLLLDTGKVDINSRDQVERTPLWWAADQGHEAITKLLLNTGKADINSKDFHKETPLPRAMRQGHDGIVKLLLETDKIDVNSKDNRLRKTTLIWAASQGNEAVVKLLLGKAKINVDSKDKDKRTPLWWAADQGHEAIVKLLLNTGKVNVDSADFYSDTPLSRAANKGHEAIVKLLLDTAKVDLNSQDHYNQTPLWWAAVQGHDAIIKMLLETGQVDVNLANLDKQSPLWRAADEGHVAVVKLLLETGKVDVHAGNYYGKTPLLMAIERGHEDVVKLLQEATL
jgi:ankyrin repeat protein